MNAPSRPADEPTPDELAEMEARKATIRAQKVADEWPKSAEPGVHWDGELWEAKVRVKGATGRSRRLLRVPDQADAIRAIRAAFRADRTLIPGGPTRTEPSGLPPEAPRESIAFPALKAAIAGGAPTPKVAAPASPLAPPPRLRPADDAPAPSADDEARRLVRPIGPAPAPPAVAATPEAPPPVPSAPAALPAELAALRAVLAAVEGLPRPAAKWALFAGLAHLEQIR